MQSVFRAFIFLVYFLEVYWVDLDRFTVTPSGHVPVTVFTDELMSKNAWSFALGVSERSLQRWEREIIDSSSLKSIYHYPCKRLNGLIVPNALDGYRRFMMLVAYGLKQGYLTNKKHSNESAVRWLNQNRPNLGRIKFNQWRDKNVKRN